MALEAYEAQLPHAEAVALDTTLRLLRQAYARGRASAIADLRDPDRWNRWRNHINSDNQFHLLERNPGPETCATYLETNLGDDEE